MQCNARPDIGSAGTARVPVTAPVGRKMITVFGTSLTGACEGVSGGGVDVGARFVLPDPWMGG